MQLKKITAVVVMAVLLAGCADANAAASTPTPTAIPTPAATATPVPTPSPTPVPTTPPEPTPEPYFTDEEQVTVDAENGYWSYSSPTLWVEIHRVFDEEKTVTYYAAEVRVKPGETERGGFSTPDRPGGNSTALYKIAKYYQAVLAVNGDFLDHHSEDPKGVIIRDDIVFADDGENTTLAFMPDGTLRVVAAGELTADELLAQGVKNAFSFGPTLINDGVIQEGLDKHYLRKKNPRCAVGMIDPYHYMLIVVDGRDDGYSTGMTLVELADLFASYGCEVAYNLDGGQSATMTFMGENLNQYGGSHTGQRGVPDSLMFGTSELVPAS